MTFRSAVISFIPSTRRRRLPVFFVNMWLPVALRCSTLPRRVMRKRLAVARCVFIFGIRSSLFRGGRDLLLRRRDHHHHVPTVLLRRRVDDREPLQVHDETVEDPATELRMRHLAPAEHNRHLHPRSRLEEPLDVPLLGGVVVRVDLRPELDLLDLDPRLLLSGFLLTDVPLVLELAVVHDSGHGRSSLRGDLYEIQIELLRAPERILRGHDPDLGAVGSDESDLWRSDPVVDPGISRDPASPPPKKEAPTHRRRSRGEPSTSGTEYRCPPAAMSRVERPMSHALAAHLRIRGRYQSGSNGRP